MGGKNLFILILFTGNIKDMFKITHQYKLTNFKYYQYKY